MTRRGAPLALAVVLLLASACGGPKHAAAGGAGARSNATGAGTPAAGDEGVSSPIARYLGYDAGLPSDPTTAQAHFAQQEKVRQDAIAACMQGKGFEYVPIDSSKLTAGTDANGLQPGTDAWVARYGFGISTQRWPQSAVGADLVGYDDSAGGDRDIQDPNQVIINQMTPDQQEAYDVALYGDSADAPAIDTANPDGSITAAAGPTPAGATADPPVAAAPATLPGSGIGSGTGSGSGSGSGDGGCQGQAEHLDNDDLSARFYREFGDELSQLYNKAQNDPRVATFDANTRTCVTARGLDYAGPEGVYNQFDNDLAEVEALVATPALSNEQYAQLSEADLAKTLNQPVVLPPEAKAKLVDLQHREVALAQAVNQCGGGRIQRDQLVQQVTAEYEQTFVDQHAQRLAELKAGK